MQRGSPHAITGWAAILFLPIAVPIGLIAQIWPRKKSADRTPEEVVGFIRDLLEGTGGEWDWDEFENVLITDPRLDSIRLRAILAGPPDPNTVELRKLISEADALAREQQ